MKNGGVDSWCKIPVETIEVGGVKVTISGLTVGQLESLTSGKRSGIDQSIVLIAACCEVDGKPLEAEKIKKCRADVFKVLSETVARVNGLLEGNLSATGDADLSSA